MRLLSRSEQPRFIIGSMLPEHAAALGFLYYLNVSLKLYKLIKVIKLKEHVGN